MKTSSAGYGRMDYVGLIFIIPLVAVCVWIIQSTRQNLQDYGATAGWKKAYWILFVPGVALGIWLTFFQTLRLPEMILYGMPVPLHFERFVDGDWIRNELPGLVRMFATIANILSGITVPMFIFKIYALAKHFKQATKMK